MKTATVVVNMSSVSQKLGMGAITSLLSLRRMQVLQHELIKRFQGTISQASFSALRPQQVFVLSEIYNRRTLDCAMIVINFDKSMHDTRIVPPY